MTRRLQVIFLQTTAKKREKSLAAFKHIIARAFPGLKAHLPVAPVPCSFSAEAP